MGIYFFFNTAETATMQGSGGFDSRPAIEKLRKDINDGLKKEVIRWEEKLNEEREARRESTILTYWALGISVISLLVAVRSLGRNFWSSDRK